MANVFRVSLILQLVAKYEITAITALSLCYHSILLLQPYQLVILQKFEHHQSVEKL